MSKNKTPVSRQLDWDKAPTPRTDAEVINATFPDADVVAAGFCRMLERELAAANMMVFDLSSRELKEELSARGESYCWLIECADGTPGGPHYWGGGHPASSAGPWTVDPFKAVRFLRKWDADMVAVNHAGANWKAVEHHFDSWSQYVSGKP